VRDGAVLSHASAAALYEVHRTPTQQATDRRRDQTHAAAGLTTLRFTHAQVVFERPHVTATLTAVAARLG
jgi:very-short-patch-repair endonuclease